MIITFTPVAIIAKCIIVHGRRASTAVHVARDRHPKRVPGLHSVSIRKRSLRQHKSYKSESLYSLKKKKHAHIWKNVPVVGRVRFSDVSRMSFTLSCCLGRETREFQAPKRNRTVTRFFLQSSHIEGVRFRTVRPIGKFFQNRRVDRMSIRGTPFAKRYTKCPIPVSRPPGRVAARTQLMLFRRASRRDVDHKSLMTWGLVGWCFSRRTHRRGRMITCRARAARCTRKPSPRPLPGWHFPKPASKFSLLTAATHRKRTVNRHSHNYATQHVYRIDNHTDRHTTFMYEKKEEKCKYGNTFYTRYTRLRISFFSISISFSLLIFLSYLRLMNKHTELSQYRHLYILPHVLYEYIYLYISPLTSVFLAFEQFSLLDSTIFVFLSISFCLDFA